MSKIRPTSSPWGAIQNIKTLDEGIFFISTAGHGGIMALENIVTNPFLKEKSLNHRTQSATWLCFEEDLDQYLIILEHRLTGKKELSPKTDMSNIVNMLSSYYPEFLISKNITLNDERYQTYLKNKELAERRVSKDPGLIVAKLRFGSEDNRLKVYTADDKIYLVESGKSDTVNLCDYKIILDVTDMWVDSLKEYIKYVPEDLMAMIGSELGITEKALKIDILNKSYISVMIDHDSLEHTLEYFRADQDGNYDEVGGLHLESFPDILNRFMRYVKSKN